MAILESKKKRGITKKESARNKKPSLVDQPYENSDAIRTTGIGNIQNVEQERRRQMIEEAAYYRAEQQGFQKSPEDYWLEAEREIDEKLS